ncbi:histidine kinase [Algoriphagus sp. C2-6-M1]|uniref:histidine kinase n=1 Tax=Algoriphagus persicinus TaxID=3108754 RepID=UPI002B3D721A|nr:histidine kinase [Algoriphagus sp. C2-6-M1]MEB2779402.1 histidine kinase [Algoriphagus sp. C2-6-M1]
MDSRLFQAFVSWYLVSIDLLLLLGIFYFAKLPKDKRANSHYWLPFLILTFTVFYENMGAYTNYNYEFKKWVNAFLGNTENPNYNLWLYNVANKHLSTILYLFLIKSWLDPSKKKSIYWMIILFIVIIQVLQFSGIEPIYSNQPIIFAIGANMILVGSGLYFISLITNDNYLNSNPLKLLSFWQMTFILFTYSLTYIYSVSLLYLFKVNPQLLISIGHIDMAMGILNLSILVLTIASPQLSRILEREPSYEPC